MKKICTFLFVVTGAIATLGQTKIIKEEYKKGIVYRYVYESFTNKTNVFASRNSSVFFLDSTIKRQQCYLKEGSGSFLKKKILDILKAHSDIFQKKHPKPSFMAIIVFPTSDGKINDSFLMWKINDFFLEADEVDLVLKDIEKLSVSYESSANTDICHCYEIGFVITKEEWGYILGDIK